jgi:hypothetical protein
VVVDGDMVHVDTGWTKGALQVPRAAISSLVVIGLGGRVDPSGRFAASVLNLHSGQLRRRAQLVLVFHEPVLLRGFRLGVENAIAVTPHERKHGALRQGLGVDLDDTSGVPALAEALGVPVAGSLAAAGVLPDPRQRAAALRMGAAGLAVFVAMLVSLTALETLRGSSRSIEPGMIGRNAVAAAGAGLVGLVVGLAYRRIRSRALVLSEPARRILPFSCFLLSFPVGFAVHVLTGVDVWVSAAVVTGLGAVGGFYAGARYWGP